MFNYKAKKNFGQNFLTNPRTINRIVEQLVTTKPNCIVEIGPGLGAFTKPLSKTNIPITAIEIDNDLIEFLKVKIPNINLINKDFLQLDLNTLNLPSNTIFYGSLPYNISKKIIRQLIEWKHFTQGFFIIQKEVADKYTAKAPQNNKLAVLTKIYAIAKKHFEISKGQFRPVPKVTSTFIEFKRQEKPLNENVNIGQLKSLINSAFTSPRKKLRNNLRGSYPKINEKEFKEIAEKRPAELSLKQFVELSLSLTSI